MKYQVKNKVFETNSSATHSITLLSREDYDDWTAGKKYLCKYGYGDNYKKGHLYTYEEIEKLAKEKGYAVEDMLEDRDFMSYETYDYYAEEYEQYWETFTTKSGDEIVAFGYYGE